MRFSRKSVRGSVSPARRNMGLTLIETLVALVLLGVITGAVVTTYVSSIQQNFNSGQRTQSVQLLNFLGRRVAGGDELLLAGDSSLTWDYGELLTVFPELEGEVGLGQAANYRASVTNLGEISLADARMVQYEILVCARAQGDETCVEGRTAGPQPGDPSDGPGALPGIS